MNFIQLNSSDKELINIDSDNILSVEKSKVGDGRIALRLLKPSGYYTDVQYSDRASLDLDYEKIKNILQSKGNTMSSIKEYFTKHQDTYITLGIIVLIDHFLFGGIFREKIQKTVENILDTTQKQLTKE